MNNLLTGVNKAPHHGLTNRVRSLFPAVLVLLLIAFTLPTARADLSVTVYKPNSNGTVARGCVQVTFIMTGVFSGTIGNATFSTTASTQTVIPINAVGDGKTLAAIPYTLAGAGTLIISEVR
jgi:hypothetical protein